MPATPTTDTATPDTAAPTPATAPATARTARLVAGVVLALTTLLASLGLGASPASAEAPAKPPTIISTVSYTDHVRVFWMPPATDGTPITGYKIERWKQGALQAEKSWTQPTARALTDTTVVPGVGYTYRIQALTADGPSPWSLSKSGKTNPNLIPLHEFDSATAFVQRQYQDLLGRSPGFGELNTTVLGLENGTLQPADVIGSLANRPERIDLRHPVIRLYFAYFGRVPDHAGMDYWVGQRAAGKKLDWMSSAFAASSEFQNTYGALSNADFVDLVYENVLHRDPDAAGLAYWTAKLDAKTISRGRLMTQFSESNEHRTKSRGRVQAVDLHDDMLGRAIKPYLADMWGSHLQAGGLVGEHGTVLMLDVDY